MKRSILFIFLVFTLLSCTEDLPEPFAAVDEPTEEDALGEEYLIFGYYHGFCGGEECIEIFKLNDSELFELIDDPYPDAADFPLSSTITPLDPTLYDQVAFVKDLVPQELLDSEESIFGIPDAYDQGGFVVEWNYNGQTGLWLMDTDTTAIPDYLHELAIGQFEGFYALFSKALSKKLTED
ncbi:MAG: hypothetical protein AAFU60_04150 [Bacteroidota bacterium]